MRASRRLALAISLLAAACRSGPSLDGSWIVPAQESAGDAPLSKEIVLVADNQFQHLYGDPVWLRTGFTNRFVSVAIRAVQLDFYARDMLDWIIGNYGNRRFVVHLGDALNMACSAEWTAFLSVMSAARQGWVMAPGNHDFLYFGNGDFERGDWARACSTADGTGAPFLKDRFVKAYLEALGGQAQRGVTGFSFVPPDPLPDQGSWDTAEAGAIVTGVAWRIDHDHPWRSFVAQRLDIRRRGQAAPVTAILLDTSQYYVRPGLLPFAPWVNAGVNGNLLDDQIEAVESWLANAPRGSVVLVLGHHPYHSLKKGSQGVLDRWRTERGVDLFVSAHTHTAQYFVHEGGSQRDTWLELNVGSTTDWPPEFRTMLLYPDSRFPGQTAVRLQRYPLHRIWDETQDPDCEPQWEVSPERPDFYVAYDELVTANAAETQAALFDALLETHRWQLRFVASDPGNRVWPRGASSDGEVAALIEKQLAEPGREAKLSFLRELDRFERERTVKDAALQRTFRLCQAKWASRYDTLGRRVPDTDDAYLIFPTR